MDPELWNRVNRIFHSALEVDPAQRMAFVEAESGGNPEVRSQVEELLLADEEAGEYLESPVIGMEALIPEGVPVDVGDVLCDRFRIVREIAEGGMGHVFEAFDAELSVPLAIKVIRPAIAANPETIARFRQEVRLARSITHPNVCRTFDMERDVRVVGGQPRELVFLTMEFLAGETLAARLKRDGALPVAEARVVATQIAGALDAAHALGIIHRDMKPANIMLGPDDSGFRAVVTDFGLARMDALTLDDGHSGFTNTGQPIGTLAYMAPEQLEGSAVSAATDIYSFGLILFELLTGERLFPATNLLSGIGARLRGTLPAERMVDPRIPAAWRSAIEDCVAVDPAERPKSGAAVVAMLGDAGGGVLRRIRKSGARLSQTLPGAGVLVAVFVMAMALFAGGLRLYQSRANSKVSAGALVYLTPVKNQTGAKQLDNVTELVRAGLSQSAQINLLDEARVGDLLHDMTKPPDAAITRTVAREIALRAGAARVVFPTVTTTSAGYRLTIDIEEPDPHDPSRARSSWTKQFDWAMDSTTPGGTVPAQLASAVRSSTDWIRVEVGESADDILHLNGSPEDVTTSSWQAMDEYVSAERLQNQGNTAKAVIALQNAVSLDPHFSLAYGRLGDLLFSSSQYGEGLRAYSQALNPDQDRRLTRRERDRILGEYSIDAVDYPAAEKAYRDETLYYPNEYSGWSYRGYPLMMMGRMDEAVASLKRAYAINPSRLNAPLELARANIAVGAFPEALRWAEVLKKQGATELAAYVVGAVEFLEHHYDDAERSFAAMSAGGKAVFTHMSHQSLARVEAERGHDEDAIKTLDDGIAADRQEGQKGLEANLLIARAAVEVDRGEYAGCIRDVRAAVAMESSAPRLMVASAILGRAHWNARGADAAALHAELLALEKQLPSDSVGTISDMARLRMRGEALLAGGDTRGALVQFRQAAELDAASNGREYLGRAYEIAAQRDGDPAAAMKDRRSAMEAYQAAVLHPSLLWFDSVDNLPGYYRRQAEAFLRLAETTPGFEDQTRTVEQELAALRESNFLPGKPSRQQAGFQPLPNSPKEKDHASN